MSRHRRSPFWGTEENSRAGARTKIAFFREIRICLFLLFIQDGVGIFRSDVVFLTLDPWPAIELRTPGLRRWVADTQPRSIRGLWGESQVQGRAAVSVQ